MNYNNYNNYNQRFGADLYRAYLEARKRKIATSNEFKFESHLVTNFSGLYEDIINRDYHPSRGIAFVTRQPVLREIFAAPFRDRIVHHYIIDKIEPWWDTRFIYDSYSCRKNKGTDFGIKRLYYMIRKVSDNFTRPVIVLKYDLQGYFTSLPRNRLFRRARWGLKQQFLRSGHTEYDEYLYQVLEFLWQEVIFDDPIQNVTVKGCKADWKKLPRRKSLFSQEPGVGIVIGNLTSQVASNIYLDQLDRFVVNNLGYENYGRYVDDFFFVLPAEEVPAFRRRIEPVIEDFITGLDLTLHPAKRGIYPVEKGVPFLGAVIYPHHIVPAGRIISHYRKDLRLVVNGRKNLESLISYMGRCQHFDSQQLQRDLWAEVGLDYRLDAHGGPSSQFFTNGNYGKKRPTPPSRNNSKTP